MNAKKIKAHLHPKCCKKRVNDSENIFGDLFKISPYHGKFENKIKVKSIETMKNLLKNIKNVPEQNGKKSSKSKGKRKESKESERNKRKSKFEKLSEKSKAPLPKSPPPPLPDLKMEEEKRMIQGKISLKK